MIIENKLFIIPVDVYMRDVGVIVSTWEQAIHSISDQLEEDESEELLRDHPKGNERGRYFMTNSGLSVVWIRQGQSPQVTYSTIVHEVVHASVAILKKIGVSLCSESEEVYTYLIEYLTFEASSKLGLSHAFDHIVLG
jgi:hypothetical protein|nr:MAG TPA: PolyVal Metallopeptidase superfamily domain [Caudoviricetes sp.]